MTRWTKKLLLLLWKNWIIQIRHPIAMILELLIPILICSLLCLMRSISPTKQYDEIIFKTYDPLVEDSALKLYKTIAFSPTNSEIQKLLTDAIKVNNMEIKNFDRGVEMEKYLLELTEPVAFGIQFDDALKNANNKLPKKIDFAIRFPSDAHGIEIDTSDIYEDQLHRAPLSRELKTVSTYQKMGFLTIQIMISKAIIEYHDKENISIPNILMQEFPFPEFEEDQFPASIFNFIQLIIIITYIYSVINITRAVADEKEIQLKECMKLVGVSNWIHWVAWFLKAILFLSISNIFIVHLLKTDYWYSNGEPAVFPNTNYILLFLFLFLFVCAVITFCFMITAIFSNATLASAFVWIIFYFLVLPGQMVSRNTTTNKKSCLMASVSVTTAMFYGMRIIVQQENLGVGSQWNNIWIVTSADGSLVLGEIFIMFLVDAVLYMLITLYLEAVFPGKNGIPKKWYFIFTCCIPRKHNATSSDDRSEYDLLDQSTFEADPDNVKPGVDIRHLRKIFPGNKKVVKDFNLIMYENQITVLLGHNGAGKTTSISMLAGMFKPTSGTAIINGIDIGTDPTKARKSMGICPQHNVLFDDLTVREHLYFYGKLKGMKTKDVYNELYNMLVVLNLHDKVNSKSSTLSGGMKRKLCVAIAFTGNSKVIMLDEPTAGMDPSARRSLWNFIKHYKEGRTILLTTHFMDEADLLGDRIAIMCGGIIKCCGTSFFLKKKYGIGYALVIAKKNNCDVDEVTNLLKSYIPDISIESNIGSELKYLLKKEYSDTFEKLLKNLEDNSLELGIESYGLSLTTMEEVFMKVGKEEGVVDKDNDFLKIETKSMELLTGSALIKNHLNAMVTKRTLITIRSWQFILMQAGLCICLLIIGLLVDMQATKTLNRIKISFDMYGENSRTVISTENNDNKYYNTMINTLNNKKIDKIGNEDINKRIIAMTKQDELNVRSYYIVGAHFGKNEIVGLYNSFSLYSSPIILNLIMNSIIKTMEPDYEILVSNYPYTHTNVKSSFVQIEQYATMFSQAITQGFSIVAACSILIYIREQTCNVKHLQFISGLSVYTYWLISIISDFFTYLIIAVISIIVILCFQYDGYKSFNDVGHVLVILLYFQFAMFPIVYLLSLYFTSSADGFVAILIIGAVGCILELLMEMLHRQTKDLANMLIWIFRLNPGFCLQNSIVYQHRQYTINQVCTSTFNACMEQKFDEEHCKKLLKNSTDKCDQLEKSYYAWEEFGILPDMIYCILIGIILYIMLFLIEYKLFLKCIYICKHQKRIDENIVLDDDIDVQEEIFKINNFTDHEIKQHSLVIINLKKYYKKHLAVNGTCLLVDQGECFGLLGINGAGKTTTFKMVTGDISMSSGEVYVNGFDLRGHPKKINKLTGYCPQFDALFDDLTPTETIKLFAMIRGFNKNDSEILSKYLSKRYAFSEHLRRRVKQLSGGNRRKVSTAVALIGNPVVVYLDEPTAGMDPASKRYIWNQLCKERDSGKCLILTSHSMEECEAICTRLAIMVKGRFKCLGSTQHLKTRFSPGYSIVIKLKKVEKADLKENIENVESFIQKTFELAELKQNYEEMMTYHIPDPNLKGSKIFAVMESAKEEYNIEDYCLSQSSLEDVFLEFSEGQYG